MALFAYPLILEPFWGTQVHSDLWLLGYGALLVMTTACIVCVNRNGNDIAAAVQRSAALSWRHRARWTMLAFIPSSLMLGVTTHISTDLAAIPLLWVLPLAAYLLTFILAFSPQAWFPGRILARARPFLALAVMFSIAGKLHGPWFIPLTWWRSSPPPSTVMRRWCAQTGRGRSHRVLRLDLFWRHAGGRIQLARGAARLQWYFRISHRAGARVLRSSAGRQPRRTARTTGTFQRSTRQPSGRLGPHSGADPRGVHQIEEG